jgi:hypothetical protein
MELNIFEKVEKIYKKDEVMSQMSEFFLGEGFIQLNNFFDKKYVSKIYGEFKKLNPQNFIKVYDPMTKKYEEIEISEKMFDIFLLSNFFRSKDFLDWVEIITSLDFEFSDLKIRRYSWKDFTLINDKEIEKEDKLIIYFDLTKDWKEEFGGYVTFLTKTEEILYLEPFYNTLTIIYKPKEVMKYLKYINNLSKGKEIIRFEIEFKV